MNRPKWTHPRRTVATTPEKNGAGPLETALRVRARSSDTAPGRPVGPRGGRLVQPLPLVGAALVLVALVGYWSVYRASTKRTPILVAAHALSAGAVLRPRDLRTGELSGDARTMAGLVPERELDRLLGHSLTVALPAGAPVSRGALGGRMASASAFTLAVQQLHALAGTLVPGDRVTVLATYGSGSGQARTRAIARGLEVLAVGSARVGLDSGSASIPITLALHDPSLASGLALANSSAKIDLLREGGRGRTAPIAPASESAAP